MEVWWGSLGSPLQVFYGIAIVTSVVMLVQLVLMLFGIDGDVDTDFDDASAGGGVLSVRTVTAFFAGFGWSGVAAIEGGAPVPLAIAIAAVVGALFMGGVLGLMRALHGLGHSGTLDYRNAVGAVGVVYLPIPAKMSAPGKIEVQVQGQLRVVDAYTDAPESLPNRSRVRVKDLLGPATLIVEPLAATPTTETTQES